MFSNRHIQACLTGAGLLLALVAALPLQAATLELDGPAGAVVSLGDRVLGEFPLDGPLELPPGRYVVRCSLPGHVPYEQAVRLAGRDDWQRLTVRLTPFSRSTAWASNILLAGLGQHYLGHRFRGYVYNVAEIGGLATALVGELRRNNLQKDYLKVVRRYETAIDAEIVQALRLEAESQYQDIKDMESLRDTGLIVAGSAIVVSVIDALLSFPSVEAGGGSVPVQTGALDTPWSPDGAGIDRSVHAGVRLGF